MSKRPWLLIVGAALAFLLGLVGVVSGVYGFGQPVNTADGLTAWPSLLTGLVAIVAAIGFWLLKKWSVYVYLLAFAGHLLTQIMLYFGRTATGRVVPPLTIIFLAIVPLLSLCILANMEYHRRKGVLG